MSATVRGVRTARSLAAVALVVPAAALVLHCGGNPPPKTPASASAASASASAPPVLISSALPSAKLPPPLDLLSHDVVADASPPCLARTATGKDPKSTLEALAKLCAGSRRDATGLAPQVVALDSTAPASTFDFQLKECAVVVATAEPSVKSYVVIVQDAKGMPIAELPGDAVTPNVASPIVCGGASKITVRVAVGAGTGKVAVGAELLRR